MLEIIQLPVLNDNYIYIIHEPESKQTAVVDPAVSSPVLALLKDKGWSLDYILNTHHHSDHIGANLELKEKTSCQIFASYSDRLRIPGIDTSLKQGDEVSIGNQIAKVIAVPGHTLGHIVYYFPEGNALFCGDTLFSMGCGRLFEGTAKQMWHSIQPLKKLPEQTKIYCAHEYTQANGHFALTVDPDNERLLQRIDEVDRLRRENKATVPTMLKEELETNPFLREDKLSIQKKVEMIDYPPVEVFRKLRELKDDF